MALAVVLAMMMRVISVCLVAVNAVAVLVLAGRAWANWEPEANMDSGNLGTGIAAALMPLAMWVFGKIGAYIRRQANKLPDGKLKRALLIEIYPSPEQSEIGRGGVNAAPNPGSPSGARGD